MRMSTRWKRKWILALLVLLIAAASMTTATFAWYIYQTSAHTTSIHMAVGTGATLQISTDKDDTASFRSKTEMKSFNGRLNPVSTNRITGGFQRAQAYHFTEGTAERPFMLAKFFEPSVENVDYYKTTLYLRANGEKRGIYVSAIDGDDADASKPIKTAIRVGLVVHEPGFYGEVTDADRDRVKEFIFELSSENNTTGRYNTYYGEPGHVLDCDKTDGSTVLFDSLLTEDNYCDYDETTGYVTLKPNTVELLRLGSDDPNDPKAFCAPVQIDVYVWLEGCDIDCTENLLGATLENLALHFAGENQ